MAGMSGEETLCRDPSVADIQAEGSAGLKGDAYLKVTKAEGTASLRAFSCSTLIMSAKQDSLSGQKTRASTRVSVVPYLRSPHMPYLGPMIFNCRSKCGRQLMCCQTAIVAVRCPANMVQQHDGLRFVLAAVFMCDCSSCTYLDTSQTHIHSFCSLSSSSSIVYDRSHSIGSRMISNSSL